MSVSLSEGDRVLFQAVRDRLAAAGATISQAADYFLANHKPLKPPLPFAELLAQYVTAKRLEGKSEGYVKTFRSSCGSFIAGREAMPVTAVTREMVRTWLFANGWEPKTMLGYLGDVRAMLEWAKAERFIAGNPVAGADGYIELPSIVDREIAAFGAEPCERLLLTALMATEKVFDRERGWHAAHLFRPLLGYAALATFAGVRPEELKRSAANVVDIESRTVIVAGAVAKTARRRVVDLSENCISWLELWIGLCPGQPGIIPVNFKRLWQRLRVATGLFAGWPHDVLRHTFATMHYAQHKNPSRLKAELGHSEDEQTLERHYRALRTVDGRVVNRTEAEYFWNIFAPPRYRETSLA